MSPRHAAPRIASVTAWQTTSASEWPSAPRSDGNRHAAEHERPSGDEPMQVVAGARAAGADGRLRLALFARGACHIAIPKRVAIRSARDRLRHRQILGRRDLDVRRLAVDEAHGLAARARPARPRRSRRRRRAPSVERGLQHVAPERLRRLREKNRLARQRLSTGPAAGRRVSGPRLPTARFTVSRACTAASAAPDLGRGGNRPRDQIRAGERARRVVNHDDVARLGRRAERVRDRVLAPLAARDDAQRLPNARARPAERDTPADRRRAPAAARRRPRRRPDARETRSTLRSRIGRPPTEQLLRLRAAEPLAASAGRDDRCDVTWENFHL